MNAGAKMKVPARLHPCYALLPLLPLTPTALADPAPVELDQVMVSASRMEKPASAIPNTVTVIERTRIDNQSLLDDSLAGILANTVPGFAPGSQKMSGGAETLRGKNPLYLIDGIPQHNSLRDGLRDGFTIDSDFLQRIEVVQGANAIQGVGATGGVVQMQTRQAKGNNTWNNELKTRLTSNDSFNSDGLGYKLTYIGDIRKDRFDFVGGISLHSRGIFYDGNDDRVGIRVAQGELQDSQARNLFVKTGVDFGIDQAQRLQLLINDYQLENNGDLLPIKGDREAGIFATSTSGDNRARFADAAKNDVTNLSLDYTHAALGEGLLRAQLYAQDYTALYEGSVSKRWQLTPGGPGVLDQSAIESDKFGIKVAYEKNHLGGIQGLRGLFGVDYATDDSQQRLTRTNRYWVPQMTLQTTSPFMQLEYLIGTDLLLSAGMRYESADLKVGDFTTLPIYNNTFVSGGTPAFNKLLKNVGLVYYASDAIALYASYSEGFDMPDVGRVLRAIKQPGLAVDNFINLTPVITKNSEVGINYETPRWRGQLSLYQSKTALGSRLEADSFGIYEVQREKQAIWGVDVSVNYQVNDNLVVGTSYAHIDGQYDSDGNGSTDTDLANNNQAPDRINAFIAGNYADLATRLQISHLIDRTQKGPAALPDNRREFNGYTLVDLTLEYASPYGHVGLGVENLFDETYETLYSQYQNLDDRYFSGRGRTLTARYRLNF